MPTALEGPSPQPNAPPAAPPSGTIPAPVADPQAPAPVAPSPAGDDWRREFAGDDVAAIEELARYKDKPSVVKALLEQKKQLSKRAEPTRLADDAKPEQVAEWRKFLGIKDVANDAQPAAYMEAYGIALPQGYEASELEKGMIGDYAKLAYGKGWDPAVVKGSVDMFLQAQQASQQAFNKMAVDRQRDWQRGLEKDLGRDYEPTIAAASAYLDRLFEESPEGKQELLRAQLPGGGYLGDHPAFTKMVAELALANGFTDRIEANSLESGGKSLAEQQSEIMSLMHSDPAKYNAPATQARLDKILELRMNLGEMDEQGNVIPQQQRRRA